MKVKNNNTWKDAAPFVKQGGLWKPVQQKLIKEAGVWQRVYEAAPVGPVAIFPSSGTGWTAMPNISSANGAGAYNEAYPGYKTAYMSAGGFDDGLLDGALPVGMEVEVSHKASGNSVVMSTFKATGFAEFYTPGPLSTLYSTWKVGGPTNRLGLTAQKVVDNISAASFWVTLQYQNNASEKRIVYVDYVKITLYY